MFRLSFEDALWLRRLAVRTPPFQGGGRRFEPGRSYQNQCRPSVNVRWPVCFLLAFGKGARLGICLRRAAFCIRFEQDVALMSKETNTYEGENDYDVVLLPSQDQVLEWRRRAACASQTPLFGVSVATFDSWLLDLWELFGDGRKIVSSSERACAMALAFRDADGLSNGTVQVAIDLAKDASGLEEFGKAHRLCACSSAENDALGVLVDAERALLARLDCYFGILAKAGLIEFGHVAAALPGLLPESFRRQVLMEGSPPLSERQRRFFHACAHVQLTEHPAQGDAGISAPPAGVDVRFAFPSGRYARPLLLADLVRDLVFEARTAACAAPSSENGRPFVVVACADPKATFDAMSGALSRENVSCALRASVPFSRTDFGGALGALNRLSQGENGMQSCEQSDLIDVLHMPFSGVSPKRARFIDAALRADRLASLEDACASVRASSQMFAYLEEMAQDPEAGILAGAVEDALRCLQGVSESYKHEQLGALAKAREAMRAACLFGLDMASCLRTLSRASVDVSCFLPGASSGRGLSEGGSHGASSEGGSHGNAPDVVVCTWAQASRFFGASCYALVAADAESAHHPVAEKEDAGVLLLRKLGLDLGESALSEARREFFALERVPSRHLIIERCLHDENADATYPAIVVEELVDCYRDDPSRTDDIDNPYALPARFLATIIERGEEHLYENAAVTHESQQVAGRILMPHMGDVDEGLRFCVVLSHTRDDGALCLSASQIESYLACPYLWFAQRRLRVEPLGEEFGPLQMGDFAHHALYEFYRRFQAETGALKVSGATLSKAKAIMAKVLDEEEKLQAELGPEDNRLVPISELERREVGALKRRLVDFLDFEACFLPGFHPACFEYEVGVKEKVEYAGTRLIGTIDRIDVDDAGHAVIVDYKGSVSSAYEAVCEDGAPPKKVQALIYAQVAKRVLGLNVVGALYLGYGRTPKIAGAFDPGVLEAAHLPAMRHDRCRCEVSGSRSFAGLLDETERRCASAIGELLAGEVAPCPAGAHACSFCPHSACAYRED